MKIVEHWSYKSFNMVIDAEFEKDVFDFDMIGGVKHGDVVRLRLTIYNPIVKREIIKNKVAQAHSIIVKYKWLKDNNTESVTILQDYEHKLAELRNCATDYVKEKIYNKNVTDGLPDSLKGL